MFRMQTPVVFATAIFAVFAAFFVCGTPTASASTITGVVYDKQRNALMDVDVELLDDLYRQFRRTRTDGSGRFQFDGLSDGFWNVKVSPFRYDYEDQTQQVEIKTLSSNGTGNGNQYAVQDFYLIPKKGSLFETELGVVFAQDVPPEAAKLYDRGVKDLAAKRLTEGIASLNKALEIFPNYYYALTKLGQTLFTAKKYEEAAHFYYKAVEINPKSATSFYYLGNSFHHLGPQYDKAALAALRQALTLAPASSQVLLALGKTERTMGNFVDAEKHLLLAKKSASTTRPEIEKELIQLYANDLKKYDLAATEIDFLVKNGNLSSEEEKEMKRIAGELREKAKKT